MMQLIVDSERNAAKNFLVLNLIETYFELTAAEKEIFDKLLAKKEYQGAKEMEQTWADQMREEGLKKGLERGREEGREEGRVKGRVEGHQAGLVAGKREILLRLRVSKFGVLPERTECQVQAMESLDELDAYVDRVLTAKSVEEMGFGD